MKTIIRSLVCISILLTCKSALSWTMVPITDPIVKKFTDPIIESDTQKATATVIGVQHIGAFSGAGIGIIIPDLAFKKSTAWITYEQQYQILKEDNDLNQKLRVNMTGFLFGNLNARRGNIALFGDFSGRVFASANFGGQINWSTNQYIDRVRRFEMNEGTFKAGIAGPNPHPDNPLNPPDDPDNNKLVKQDNRVELTINQNVSKPNIPNGNAPIPLSSEFLPGQYKLSMLLLTEVTTQDWVNIGASGQLDINPPPPKILNRFPEQLIDESQISLTSDSDSQISTQDYNDMVNFSVTLDPVSE